MLRIPCQAMDKGYVSDKRKRARGVLWAVKDKRKRGRCLSSSQKKRNKKRGAVRAKVEHIFRVLKCQFGYRKARYRGLAKNAAQMFSLPLGIMLRITLPGNEWHSPTFTWRGNI